MAALLPPGECQFADANGNPYALGTLETLIISTDTPKATWTNAAKSALNTNPIVLDSAGRAVIYGDGLYRTILRDVDGNEIWDQPSSTLVSDALAPVIIAATIADALVLLGVQDAIDASVLVETTRAEAAEAAEATTRAAADTALTTAIASEATTRAAADTALSAAIAAETARALAAEAALGTPGASVLQVRTGTSHSGNPNADCSITFGTPFPTACTSVQAKGAALFPELYFITLTDNSGFPVLPTASGATGYLWGYTGGAGDPPVAAADLDFVWTAIGY